jgi:hypothetical protein
MWWLLKIFITISLFYSSITGLLSSEGRYTRENSRWMTAVQLGGLGLGILLLLDLLGVIVIPYI